LPQGHMHMGLSNAAETARRLVEPVLTVVFPSACAGCGRPLSQPTRGPLCATCWDAVPRHETPTCRCGLPLPPGRPTCGRCRRGRQPLAASASLGPYEGALRIAIHELKYRGRRRVAGRLAEALLEARSARALVEGSDVLVPVPLHPRRLRERGFNQSQHLARTLGTALDTPVNDCVLKRTRNTPSQTELDRKERRGNVSGAFALSRKAPDMEAILLVDDVLTTGATLEACCMAFVDSGIHVAGAAVVALAEPPAANDSRLNHE